MRAMVQLLLVNPFLWLLAAVQLVLFFVPEAPQAPRSQEFVNSKPNSSIFGR